MEDEYKKLKKQTEKEFKKIWGPRCDHKDTEFFPEAKKNPDYRCMTCRSYDALDNFFAELHKSL